MRVTIKPSAHPSQEIDVTSALVSAVAAEIWKHCGGNDVVNWMEAERFIQTLVVPPAPLAERKSRPLAPRPSRPRDDAGRPLRRLSEADSEQITGPLPLY